MPESGFKFGTKVRKSNWIGKREEDFGVQPSPPLKKKRLIISCLEGEGTLVLTVFVPKTLPVFTQMAILEEELS